MIAKLAMLILMGGLTAAGLLVVRQQRLQTVHEMAASIERSAELDRKLWRMRTEIASRITPGKVREAVLPLGEMQPIPMYWCPPPVGEQMAPPTIIGEGKSKRSTKNNAKRSQM